MMMLLQDRFARGLLAGISAGFITLFWNCSARYLMHFSTLNYWDFAAAFILHKPIGNLWEGVFAFMIVKMFFGFLGVVFSYLIQVLQPSLILLKGLAFGLCFWFAIYALIIIFRVPNLTGIPPQTTFSNLIGAALYGLMLGYFLQWLTTKVEKSW